MTERESDFERRGRDHAVGAVGDESRRAALDALFHARRVAIMGASEKTGFANSIQRALIRGGYTGEILPVNPNYETVLGSRAYATLDEIEGEVDLAIVVLPVRLTQVALDACERKGVRAVYMIASGFAEKPGDAEGQARQEALQAFVARTGIRLVGPNCLGFISTANDMVAKSGPYFGAIPRGPIAGVFQSGLLSYSLVTPCVDRGIGFTYVITTGNEADLTTADFINYFIDDPDTRVIAALVEQFRQPEAFLAAAQRAAEAGKPLVVLKIGRSEGGRRSALAHTGAMVGSDAVADAVMRQHGIIRVATMDEMVETLAAFHAPVLPQGDGVSALFLSGGAAGLMSDIGEDLGLRFPELSAETTAKLTEIIPAFGTIGNPLDTTGQIWEIPGAFSRAVETLADDPNVDIVIYGRHAPGRLDLHPEVGEFPPDLPARYPNKLFFILSHVGGTFHDISYPEQQMLVPATSLGGIPFLQTIDNGLRAIRNLLDYAAFQRGRQQHAHATSAEVTSASDAALNRTTAARDLLRAADGAPLVGRAANAVLALYGIPTTREQLAADADAAVAAADAIGYPVVLKVESAQVLHKTEAGGVLLGVADADGVRAGVAQILASVAAYDPSAQIDGVLVQELARPGRELLLGMSQDSTFGPAIAVGLGGVFTETLNDLQLGVPPLTAHDAQQMLQRLRAWPVLQGTGARGAGAADIPAVVDVLQRFSILCHDLADAVAEIDINPLVVYGEGEGALVLDCLIVPHRAAEMADADDTTATTTTTTTATTGADA